MRNSLVEQQVILANAFGSSKNTIYRYHGMVGAAVAIVISIMHEKLCIYMQNTQKKLENFPNPVIHISGNHNGEIIIDMNF